MSSTYQSFVAARAIDGDKGTQSITGAGTGNWLSVLVSPGTPIGYVALWNWQGTYAYLLTDIEMWASDTAGDTTSGRAVKCGETSYDGREPAPYVLWCGGVRRRFVTVKQVSAPSYLCIEELEIFVQS